MSLPLRAESPFLIDMSRRYRLVTRSDFDGLVCAVLLKHLDILDDIKFVHPKDMQDGTIEITEDDITTNVPYVSGCYLAFDCLLYTSPSPRDRTRSRMPSSA